MTQDERIAFLDEFCGAPEGETGDFTDCNVTVTANTIDTDGRNDSWTIEADNDTGLICSRGALPSFIIGVAENVSFTIAADPE